VKVLAPRPLGGIRNMDYYNEIEPYAAQWLENMIDAGHLPLGVVDRRPIQEVKANELEGFERLHFFAGIGGWPRALELAGWPGERSGGGGVWTGSCPCQPFSCAGKRRGVNDERHLWPVWLGLIRERLPPVIYGEQVASKDGRKWLAGVFDDLETLGYACAGADLCAASVGAPHVRQRLFWLAYAEHAERRAECEINAQAYGGHGSGGSGDAGGLGDADSESRELDSGRLPAPKAGVCGSDRAEHGNLPERLEHAGEGVLSFWSDFDLIPCRDGKARRVEPGIFPLAHGVPNRVGKLRAYGNAIVPQVAAEFIRSTW